MFKGEKNLKDSKKDSIKDTSSSVSTSYQTVGFSSGSVISYTKTNKLITALYMVTDIIDKDEPLRNKLRALGVEILSDISMSKMPFNISKIDQILSFLDIAAAMSIISEMNFSILKKEFLELNQSIIESIGNIGTTSRQINLTEFFQDSSSPFRGGFEERFLKNSPHPNPLLKREGELNSKGHTRIGVQKGSTLMRALSDKLTPEARPMGYQEFDVLKKQRRNDIINIIKTIDGNVTIKDIKDKAQESKGQMISLVSCSEKTLQRELVSMVKDSVLNKVGEKRWSRYFLK